MKKLFAFCAGLLAVLNQTAVTALAAEPEAAARGRVLVPAVPDPVRREVRCAEGGGDDTGMYHK